MRLALFHNLSSGGAKRALFETVRHLVERHDVTVYTLSSADHAFADLRPLVRNHRVFDFRAFPLLDSPLGRLNQALRISDLLRLAPLHRTIASEIEAGRYDAVLVHPCRFEQSPSVLKFLSRVPTLYYCQEPLRRLYETMPPRPYDDVQVRRRAILNRVDPLPALYHGLLRRIDRRNLRSAGTVLVSSAFVQQTVRSIYGVESKISPLGVDTEHFHPTNGTRLPMVLSVGSLTPLKGFDFLVESIARCPAGSRPRLVIASNFQNSPERSYLRDLASARQVDLQLLASVSDDDLVHLYNQASVVAYAPIREPFGLVPLEAMACGTPVVAVREGGPQETVLEGQTGFLVERDPEQFAWAIQRLLSDAKRAAGLGVAGRAHVLQQWSWKQSAATLERYLDNALASAESLTAATDMPDVPQPQRAGD